MIVVDLARCTGCRRCETACAFFHTGRINPALARIKVLNLYESGVDAPVVCVQCRERYCLRCSESAITVKPQGQVVVSPTLCNLCGGRPKCIEACTEGAIVPAPDVSGIVSLEDVRAKTRFMTPALKRQFYVQRAGQELRKAWEKDRA
jgi:carbon-monoxide dehydrogenase iron sulfur subunit